MSEENQSPTARKKSNLPTVLSFCISIGFFAFIYALLRGQPQGELGHVATYFMLNLLLSIVATILALIPPTRRVGLGMLLACGLMWLIISAMCGGVFREISPPSKN